jgi:hypothetical protein
MSTLSQLPRIFVFTHPRTASNLFIRLFESHPDLSIVSYPFQDAFFWGPDRTICSQGPLSTQRTIPDATYQNRFNQLQQFVVNAEAAGKIPFIKEHIYYITDPQIIPANVTCLPKGAPFIPNTTPTIDDGASASAKSISLPNNPTALSNEFLTTLSPVILIRHPAKIIPSYYRLSKDAHGTTVFDEFFPVNASLRWSRLIFDWYAEYYSISGIEKRPIVIDAEDMINDSRNVIEKFCEITGLDPKHVQWSWSEKPDSLRRSFMSTLWNSTGIIRGDQVSISLVTI